MSDVYSEQGPQFDDERTPAEGAESGDEELLERFAKWDVALQAHWSEWAQDADLWYEFAAGDQWTAEERASMEGAGKIPVTFNLVAPTIDAVRGAEIQNRQQVQYYPREVGDTGVSDVLTQGAEYVNDECNGDQEDSEAFWDCLVCGIGCTETRPEVEGDQVCLVKEAIDPRQIRVDPASRKKCFEDRRYAKREIPMSPDEFEDFKLEIGRPELRGLDGTNDPDGKRLTIVNPRQRYTHGMLGTGDEDTVIVCEWQWWDREPVYLAAVPDPAKPGVVQVRQHTEDEFAALQKTNPGVKSSRSHRKVYYRAFTQGQELLFKETMPEGAFRWQFITGKRDRKRGTWFGLVKPMFDPGKFVNKLYSEILHIVRTNANGGMALEEDAVSDVRQFEDSWAATDKITWLKPGSLSGAHGSKMMPKTPPPVQAAFFQLMEFAKEMVKATTGVNEEILGLVAREQAGVLEAQRKQAAYGILSDFFDAKRRYQRDQGRLLLRQMSAFFPADKLVRVVDQGTAQYVPLAMSLEAQEYDIVVDEAPAGPDQKEKVLSVLMPLIPQFVESGLISPESLADLIEYLPVPAAVSKKLADAIRQQAQQAASPNPEQQAMAQAELENKQADTAGKKAKAFKDVTDAHESHIGLGVEFMRAMAPQPAPQASPPSGGPPPGASSPAPPMQPGPPNTVGQQPQGPPQ